MTIFRLDDRAPIKQFYIHSLDKRQMGQKGRGQSHDCWPSPAVACAPGSVLGSGEIFPNVKLHHNANGILSKVETQYDWCLNRVRNVKCSYSL